MHKLWKVNFRKRKKGFDFNIVRQVRYEVRNYGYDFGIKVKLKLKQYSFPPSPNHLRRDSVWNIIIYFSASSRLQIIRKP